MFCLSQVAQKTHKLTFNTDTTLESPADFSLRGKLTDVFHLHNTHVADRYLRSRDCSERAEPCTCDDVPSARLPRERFHVIVHFKMAVVIVVVAAEGAENEWTDLGFMVRRLMWRQTPVAGSGSQCCVCACLSVLTGQTSV